MIGRRDLRAICRPPMGVAVSFAGVSTYPDDGSAVCGLFDREVVYKGGDSGLGGVENAMPVLSLPCGAFRPMPAVGDELQVTDDDGVLTSYKVNAPSTSDDGGFQIYELFRVTDGEA